MAGSPRSSGAGREVKQVMNLVSFTHPDLVRLQRQAQFHGCSSILVANAFAPLNYVTCRRRASLGYVWSEQVTSSFGCWLGEAG
jgi:hypothetical protein